MQQVEPLNTWIGNFCFCFWWHKTKLLSSEILFSLILLAVLFRLSESSYWARSPAYDGCKNRVEQKRKKYFFLSISSFFVCLFVRLFLRSFVRSLETKKDIEMEIVRERACAFARGLLLSSIFFKVSKSKLSKLTNYKPNLLELFWSACKGLGSCKVKGWSNWLRGHLECLFFIISVVKQVFNNVI